MFTVLRVVSLFLLPIITCTGVLLVVSAFCNWLNPETAVLNKYLAVELKYFYVKVGWLVAVVLAAGFILLLLYDLLSSIMNLGMALALFNRPGYRRIFVDSRKHALASARSVSSVGGAFMLILGLLIAVALAMGELVSTFAEVDPLTQVRGFILESSAIGGALMGVGISLPSLSYHIARYRQFRPESEDKVRRLLVYGFGQMIWIPIMIYIALNVMVPMLGSIYEHIYSELVAPKYGTEIILAREALQDLSPNADQSTQELIREYVATIDNNILPATRHSGLPEFLAQLDPFLRAIVSALIWLILTVTLMSLLLPYFITGGWRRGLLYVIILGASFAVEHFLSGRVPGWFILESGSLPAALLIAFVIFANAVTFDWLYEMFSKPKAVCQNCASEIEAGSTFCSHCGLPQGT